MSLSGVIRRSGFRADLRLSASDRPNRLVVLGLQSRPLLTQHSRRFQRPQTTGGQAFIGGTGVLRRRVENKYLDLEIASWIIRAHEGANRTSGDRLDRLGDSGPHRGL